MAKRGREEHEAATKRGSGRQHEAACSTASRCGELQKAQGTRRGKKREEGGNEGRKSRKKAKERQKGSGRSLQNRSLFPRFFLFEKGASNERESGALDTAARRVPPLSDRGRRKERGIKGKRRQNPDATTHRPCGPGQHVFLPLSSLCSFSLRFKRRQPLPLTVVQTSVASEARGDTAREGGKRRGAETASRRGMTVSLRFVSLRRFSSASGDRRAARERQRATTGGTSVRATCATVGFTAGGDERGEHVWTAGER